MALDISKVDVQLQRLLFKCMKLHLTKDVTKTFKPSLFKGEVRSRKILPPLIELFHRNSKIIAVLSSLLCNYDKSALKLLLSTTFATRKTLSWI